MHFEGVGLLSGLAALSAVVTWGILLPNPTERDELKHVRARMKWPLLCLCVILGYVIWDRQSVIDRTCDAMHRAMDFDGGGQSDPKTLDFKTSVKLMDLVPGLKDAVTVCSAS